MNKIKKIAILVIFVLTATLSLTACGSAAQSIEVATMPAKTNYVLNEPLKLDGGKLNVTFSNGNVQEISMDAEGVTVSGFDNTKTGQQDVTVKYKKKDTSFAVTVKSVTSFTVKKLPNKTVYTAGETLSLEGGVMRVVYADGTSADVTMTYAVPSGFDLSTNGDKTVTLTYGGKTNTFPVVVGLLLQIERLMLRFPTFTWRPTKPFSSDEQHAALQAFELYERLSATEKTTVSDYKDRIISTSFAVDYQNNTIMSSAVERLFNTTFAPNQSASVKASIDEVLVNLDLLLQKYNEYYDIYLYTDSSTIYEIDTILIEYGNSEDNFKNYKLAIDFALARYQRFEDITAAKLHTAAGRAEFGSVIAAEYANIMTRDEEWLGLGLQVTSYWCDYLELIYEYYYCLSGNSLNNAQINLMLLRWEVTCPGVIYAIDDLTSWAAAGDYLSGGNTIKMAASRQLKSIVEKLLASEYTALIAIYEQIEISGQTLKEWCDDYIGKYDSGLIYMDEIENFQDFYLLYIEIYYKFIFSPSYIGSDEFFTEAADVIRQYRMFHEFVQYNFLAATSLQGRYAFYNITWGYYSYLLSNEELLVYFALVDASEDYMCLTIEYGNPDFIASMTETVDMYNELSDTGNFDVYLGDWYAYYYKPFYEMYLVSNELSIMLQNPIECFGAAYDAMDRADFGVRYEEFTASLNGLSKLNRGAFLDIINGSSTYKGIYEAMKAKYEA